MIRGNVIVDSGATRTFCRPYIQSTWQGQYPRRRWPILLDKRAPGPKINLFTQLVGDFDLNQQQQSLEATGDANSVRLATTIDPEICTM